MTPKSFRRWRKSLHLSQKEAAQALGLKRRVVQYYEKGERDGEPIAVPLYVRLACYALSRGVADYQGPQAEAADLPADAAAERAVEAAAAKTVEKAVEKAAKKAAGKTTGKTTGKKKDVATGPARQPDRVTAGAGDRPVAAESTPPKARKRPKTTRPPSPPPRVPKTGSR